MHVLVKMGINCITELAHQDSSIANRVRRVTHGGRESTVSVGSMSGRVAATLTAWRWRRHLIHGTRG